MGDSAETRKSRMPPKGKRGRPKKGEEKKQRKKKDPNAPKRPMSAYFLFMNATRPTVRKENPDASIGEVAKSSARCGERLNQQTRPSLTRTQLLPRRSGRLRRRLTPRRENLQLRLRRVGMRKMRRRRRLKTANKKGAKFRSKETKGRSREFTPEE